MKATVTWQENMRFVGKTDNGKTLEMDGNSDSDVVTPMESVLLSVGSCSSIDVVDILKKSRQQISNCICELSAERAESAPRVFTTIHAHYIVQGDKVSEKHVARAVQLSTEKYCSVMLMLDKKVLFTTSFVIQ
jgi:putative redox protein